MNAADRNGYRVRFFHLEMWHFPTERSQHSRKVNGVVRLHNRPGDQTQQSQEACKPQRATGSSKKGQINSSAKCKTPWHAAGRAEAKKGTIKKWKYHGYVILYSKGIVRGMMGRLPIPLPIPYRYPTDTLVFDLQPSGPKHLKPLCALAFTRKI